MKALEQLQKHTEDIGKALALQIDISNGDEVKGKLDELQRLLPVSSWCVAQADMLYNEKIGQLIEDHQYRDLGATDKKLVFQGKAKKEIYYMTLCDRQNKSITHSMEALRSILSYLKSEMQL